MLAVGLILISALLLGAMTPTTAYAGDVPAEQAQELAEGGQEQQPTAQKEQLPQNTLEANIEQLPVKESVIVKSTTIKDLPWSEGQDIGELQTGQTVNVFSTGVNEDWVAIVMEGRGFGYVSEQNLAMTAGYQYEYLSDLTRITGYSGEQLEKALAGTGLAGLGEYYAQKEKTHGINALFLIGIAKLESAGGSSRLARAQNNLGGLKNGKGGYMSFATKEDCVEYMATLLKDKYLTPGAKHYFGNTSKNVSVRYCEQSASWYTQVEDLMNKSYQKVLA